MNKIKDILAIAGVALLVGAVLWLACSVSYRAGLRHAPAPGKPDTEYVDKPIYIDKPVPVVVYRDTGRVVYVPVVVKDSTGHVDTTAVPMHPEVKQYGDSTYRAQVSGIHPNLDWIEVYQRTYYITREVQVPGPAPLWSFNVTADAQAQKGFYQARAGLLYERQVSSRLRWRAGGGYQVSNLGRGPYLETGLQLGLFHNR